MTDPPRTAEQILEHFRPSIERDLRARLHLERFRVTGRGSEGEGGEARLGHLPVWCKVGRSYGPTVDMYADYAAAAQVVGLELPGVARVYGVWVSDTGHYAVVRELVSTDWRAYARAHDTDPLTLERAVDDLSWAFRPVMWACIRGTERPEHQPAPYGLGPVLDGLSALAREGVCAGIDLDLRNLGFRPDTLEPVLVDLGLALAAHGRAWQEPATVR